MVRVLVVEDEANIRDMIALNLRHAGMEVVEAESAEAALPLLARVEALCRRVIRTKEGESRENTPLGTLTSGDFVLDENRRVLLKAGRPIELTQVEFQIMELFFHNPGIALVREKILKGVWGENYFGDVKIVDVNIRRLRMKVEDEPSHQTHIMTVWGYGYRWEE